MQKNISPSQKNNRSFGLLFSLISFVFSVHLYYTHSSLIAAFFISMLAICLLLLAFTKPQFLTFFSDKWRQLGEILGKVFSPIILGIIFFLIITPIAIIGKLFGRDELALKKKSASSYWIDRKPDSLTHNSFKYQF